jgi:hypothetical protein
MVALIVAGAVAGFEIYTWGLSGRLGERRAGGFFEFAQRWCHAPRFLLDRPQAAKQFLPHRLVVNDDRSILRVMTQRPCELRAKLLPALA